MGVDHLDAANWQPLTWLSLQLDATLFGLNAAGFHGVNLAMHVANTVLLFLALWQMTAAARPAFQGGQPSLTQI